VRLRPIFKPNQKLKTMKYKSFFGEIFTPLLPVAKVRIERKGGIYVLMDDADQDLGYEFESFDQAFRFAKIISREVMDTQTF
jgi:hypothetical protein